MDQPRIYKIIGMPILIALIISGFMIFLGSGTDTYGQNYDEESFEEIKNASQSFSSVTTDIENSSNPQIKDEDFDKSGSLLFQGYQAANKVKDSFSLFNNLLDSSIDNMGLGSYTQTIKILSLSLIATVIGLGIVLLILLKVRV